MLINRRQLLLQGGTALAMGSLLPRIALADDAFAPQPGEWRTFEVTTRLQIQAEGPTQAWIPIPAVNESAWFRSLGSNWMANTANAKEATEHRYGAAFVHAEWDASESNPVIEVRSKIATRDRAIDFANPTSSAPLPDGERALYTRGTDLIPVDGIVKETSDRITAGAGGDLAKARAIYEWVVENTYRNAATRGCGIGDIGAMLTSGNFGGKCADLNALYVGLARSAGLPARDVYGIRVAPSKFGYKSLGAGSEVITKAQHCRSEVYLDGFGWVPVDPADVRKVMLEEPPKNLPIDDPKVVAARKALFGSWETNWLAYNFAHDVVLPGAAGPRLGFLMYPQAETAGLRFDCLDPDNFKYTITSREIAA